MSVEGLWSMKARGLLPNDKELLPAALQMAAAVPACEDAETLLRSILAMEAEGDQPVWDATAQALGYYPEGGTSLIRVTSERAVIVAEDGTVVAEIEVG